MLSVTGSIRYQRAEDRREGQRDAVTPICVPALEFSSLRHIAQHHEMTIFHATKSCTGRPVSDGVVCSPSVEEAEASLGAVFSADSKPDREESRWPTRSRPKGTEGNPITTAEVSLALLGSKSTSKSMDNVSSNDIRRGPVLKWARVFNLMLWHGVCPPRFSHGVNSESGVPS